MMLPAPRKPTPVITPWMMRVGSRFGPPMFSTACLVTSTNMVEPRHTSVWVRNPAGLRPSWRSHPIMVPKTVDTSMATRSWTTNASIPAIAYLPPWVRFDSIRAASSALESRRAFFQERGESFVHVLARREDPEQAALEPEPGLERQLK